MNDQPFETLNEFIESATWRSIDFSPNQSVRGFLSAEQFRKAFQTNNWQPNTFITRFKNMYFILNEVRLAIYVICPGLDSYSFGGGVAAIDCENSPWLKKFHRGLVKEQSRQGLIRLVEETGQTWILQLYEL